MIRLYFRGIDDNVKSAKVFESFRSFVFPCFVLYYLYIFIYYAKNS